MLPGFLKTFHMMLVDDSDGDLAFLLSNELIENLFVTVLNKDSFDVGQQIFSESLPPGNSVVIHNGFSVVSDTGAEQKTTVVHNFAIPVNIEPQRSEDNIDGVHTLLIEQFFIGSGIQFSAYIDDLGASLLGFFEGIFNFQSGTQNIVVVGVSNQDVQERLQDSPLDSEKECSEVISKSNSAGFINEILVDIHFFLRLDKIQMFGNIPETFIRLNNDSIGLNVTN
mmetsp:Transcript_30254/g.34359  ORF Transcript_30254/g.34359 Transcript_30254/m.34359 type:complete len:225 (+) Transcript_30254:954-1628(+)